MALTLKAVYDKANDADLRNTVAAAAWRHAKNIIQGATPALPELKWANRAMQDDGSGQEICKLTRAIVVVLDDGTINDSTIQTAVGQIVAKLISLET